MQIERRNTLKKSKTKGHANAEPGVGMAPVGAAYARLVRRFAELTGRSDALKTPSVQAKLTIALNVTQNGPQSVDCLALRFFRHIFPFSEQK